MLPGENPKRERQCSLPLEEHKEDGSWIFGRDNRLDLAFADLELL